MVKCPILLLLVRPVLLLCFAALARSANAQDVCRPIWARDRSVQVSVAEMPLVGAEVYPLKRACVPTPSNLIQSFILVVDGELILIETDRESGEFIYSRPDMIRKNPAGDELTTAGKPGAAWLLRAYCGEGKFLHCPKFVRSEQTISFNLDTMSFRGQRVRVKADFIGNMPMTQSRTKHLSGGG